MHMELENPDADITLLKFMDEQRTRSDLAVQETRQQLEMNELKSRSFRVTEAEFGNACSGVFYSKLVTP